MLIIFPPYSQLRKLILAQIPFTLSLSHPVSPYSEVLASALLPLFLVEAGMDFEGLGRGLIAFYDSEGWLHSSSWYKQPHDSDSLASGVTSIHMSETFSLSVCHLPSADDHGYKLFSETEPILHVLLRLEPLSWTQFLRLGGEPLDHMARRLSWHASFKSAISYLSAARRSASRLCENMLRKTGDLAARTARWVPMLPSEALMMMSVWMPSVNIRPRHARAVAFDCFSVNPSAHMEQENQIKVNCLSLEDMTFQQLQKPKSIRKSFQKHVAEAASTWMSESPPIPCRADNADDEGCNWRIFSC
ncbi:hypothetical protein QQP08_021013 [Theobroma cacao]|nr:hypothetical protein QQP08_021013 [Theobroma cacao]